MRLTAELLVCSSRPAMRPPTLGAVPRRHLRVRVRVPAPRRQYSVRIPADSPSASSITTVADLRAWHPTANVPDVQVCGWVRSVRKSSGVRFVDVTDGSSMRPVQAVVDKKLSAEYDASSPSRSRQGPQRD